MVGSTFNFLDLSLRIEAYGTISTSIYVKPTDKGVYTHFRSHIPLQYKTSLISTLVTRAIKFSSSWQACSIELNRLRQTLVNNSYPLKLIDDVIKKKIRSNPETTNDLDDDVTFYLALYNLSNFASGTKEIRTIITDHVKTSLPTSSIRVVTYYRPYKLGSQLSTRSRCDGVDKSGVVYSFKCPLTTCHAVYYGHTTQTLSSRIKQHRYVSSSITKHFNNDHDMAVPNYNELMQCFSIEFSSNEPIQIKIVEALKIKIDRPYINVKYDVMNNLLKLF